jgi:hypothetical protein
MQKPAKRYVPGIAAVKGSANVVRSYTASLSW